MSHTESYVTDISMMLITSGATNLITTIYYLLVIPGCTASAVDVFGLVDKGCESEVDYDDGFEVSKIRVR